MHGYTSVLFCLKSWATYSAVISTRCTRFIYYNMVCYIFYCTCICVIFYICIEVGFHEIIIILCLYVTINWKKLVFQKILYFPAHKTPFYPEKCDLNSTCVLCAEDKYYFQTYKYLYVYYTTSLLWDSEICFQIMRSGITAFEWLVFF